MPCSLSTDCDTTKKAHRHVKLGHKAGNSVLHNEAQIRSPRRSRAASQRPPLLPRRVALQGSKRGAPKRPRPRTPVPFLPSSFATQGERGRTEQAQGKPLGEGARGPARASAPSTRVARNILAPVLPGCIRMFRSTPCHVACDRHGNGNGHGHGLGLG